MKKIFYGWWIVLATSLIHFWGAGTFFYSFTAFFNPIVNEFGWSYAATSFAASLRSIEGGIASPIFGYAADRWGARILLLLGSILTGIGFILLSRIHALWSFYTVFIFLSIGCSLLFPVPGWTALANWFQRYRGTALGILSTSIGLGGVLVFGVNWLIDAFGWRHTMVIIGIVTWAIGIPASLVVRHRPEPYGMVPDGEKAAPSPSSGKADGADDNGFEESGEYTTRQAAATPSFKLLALIVTLSSGTVHALTVHVMPYLTSVDFDRSTASIVAAFLVFSSTLGRFGMGWLATYIKSRYLMAISLLLQAMGLLILSVTDTMWEAVAVVLLFGPGYGGVITLRLTLQAEYFGKKAFGAIQGLIMAIAITGTMSFPYLTGLYYDMVGTYRSSWLIMAGLILAVTPLAFKLQRPEQRPVFDSVSALPNKP